MGYTALYASLGGWVGGVYSPICLPRGPEVGITSLYASQGTLGGIPLYMYPSQAPFVGSPLSHPCTVARCTWPMSLLMYTAGLTDVHF